jgi:hypothetical protein
VRLASTVPTLPQLVDGFAQSVCVASSRHAQFADVLTGPPLFDRLCMSVKPVSGVENYYAIDASDAGKVAFLLTGIEDTSPQLCYEIMKAPVRTPDVFHFLTEAGSFVSNSGPGSPRVGGHGRGVDQRGRPAGRSSGGHERATVDDDEDGDRRPSISGLLLRRWSVFSAGREHNSSHRAFA